MQSSSLAHVLPSVFEYRCVHAPRVVSHFQFAGAEGHAVVQSASVVQVVRHCRATGSQRLPVGQSVSSSQPPMHTPMSDMVVSASTTAKRCGSQPFAPMHFCFQLPSARSTHRGAHSTATPSPEHNPRPPSQKRTVLASLGVQKS
jgi:hypothetical protein